MKKGSVTIVTTHVPKVKAPKYMIKRQQNGRAM
jgi:hypothetical protein